MSFSLTDRVFSKSISDTCFSRRIAGSAKQPNIHWFIFFLYLAEACTMRSTRLGS